MDFRFSKEEERWRQEVHDWLSKEIPADWWGENNYTETSLEENTRFCKQSSKKLAQKGWIGMAWPKEWGGRTLIEHAIFVEEMGYHLAPVVCHQDAEMVGAAILAYGTEEQKRHFIPPIKSNEHTYCLTYTEPEAGSDLANLQTRAIREGDYWIINGHKVLNEYTHRVNSLWLAARTDPEARKHRGISVFAIEPEKPEAGFRLGITVRPMWTVASPRLNAVYFDNVRVPHFNLIGEPNTAWYGAMNNQKYMGVGIAWSPITRTKRYLDELVRLCQETKRNGTPLTHDPFVRRFLAESAISIEVQRAAWWREVWEMSKYEEKVEAEAPQRGGVQPLTGQGTVLWSKEFVPWFYERALEIIGLYGQLQPGSKWAPLAGQLEREYRWRLSNHSHGTPEVIRMVLATVGLDLPRR